MPGLFHRVHVIRVRQTGSREIAERGALGVVGAHTSKTEVDQDGIRDMLSWVTERDIEILTLREAIDIYAN